MNQYIERIENAVWTSKNDGSIEPTRLNEITVYFIEPPSENKYNLTVERVQIWDERGIELSYAKNYSFLLPVTTYPSKCKFYFEFDQENDVYLLDGASFEIRLHKTGPNPVETIRYILKENQWKERAEE